MEKMAISQAGLPLMACLVIFRGGHFWQLWPLQSKKVDGADMFKVSHSGHRAPRSSAVRSKRNVAIKLHHRSNFLTTEDFRVSADRCV
jgi:hypothetical protein